MAEDFDISEYLQGISVGVPDSSFDSGGFSTDLFGSTSGKGFNDEGFNLDFLDALTSGDILDSDNPFYSGSGFNDEGFNIDSLIQGLSSKKDDRNAFQKLLGAFGVGGGSGGSKNNTLATLLALGGSSFLKDRGYLDKDIPVVGYQGEIPKYQAIQEVVKGRDDSDRRPGSGGRRYMSDVIYAKAPENQEPMSVADAQTKAQAQAQGFNKGGYLNGDSDGQADEVPGSIDGVQEARLSHGEYVLPADLVSLLGNGNSDAGAKALDDFMAMVRKKGTGTEKQQKNIKADKVLASLMNGKG